MKKIAVLIAFVLLIAVGDVALTYNSPIIKSDRFEKNDFEIIKNSHSEKVWDKVIFGSDAVTCAYMEGEKGYVNLGLGGVKMTDLEKMIDTRHITLGTELVIGLDYTLFCGEDETEYIWDKKIYEPYVYFERERLLPVIKNETATSFVNEKTVRRGVVHEREMQKMVMQYESMTAQNLAENIASLENVIAYCNEKGINIRCVWMPWNVGYDKTAVLDEVRMTVDAVLSSHGIDVYDMESIFSVGDFYDVMHLNYDIGSPKFTALIDEWL